jgi:hypothetical protein
MRRFLGLVVLFAVLSTCVPSYGNYFLIYNVSATVKGVDFDFVDGAVTVPLKGYLLLTLSDANSFVDANLVLYGKNADRVKKYVQLDYHSDTFLQSTYTWNNLGYFGLIIDGGYSFGFRGQLMGKTALKDVGLGATSKKSIASSLKGVLNVEEGMLLDIRQDIAGTATISMTLNSSVTKSVNDTDPTWNAQQILEGQLLDGVLRGIKPDLEAKGYADASPPPP